MAREIYLTSLGRISYSPGDGYPTPGHPKEHLFTHGRGRKLNDFAAVWIESGHGVMEAASTGRTEFSAGHVLLLPPGSWHRYHPDPEIGWVERWICANGAYLRRLGGRDAFPSVPELRPIREAGELDAAFDRLRAAAQPGSLHVAGLTLSCLALALGAHENLDDPATQARTGSLVESAVGFIWTHCHQKMSVADVARHVGVSRRALERHFANRSHTVAREITLARLERARSLLAQGTLNVKEVGHAAGFDGPKRFIEAHRRVFGVTPGSRKRSPPT